MPLDLFPYQEKGAAFLASKDRAGLFDAMGIGKSAQAIRALDIVGAKRIVIVCPAAVREVWKGEFAKFARIPRRIIKGKDIQDLNTWLRGKSDVILLSYEMATKWAHRMGGDIIDAVIFDEAHYLKSWTALRTIALLGDGCDGRTGLASWGARVWLLTGTPNPNDAADVWSMMRFCKATRLSRDTFCNRYYKSRMGSFSSSHTPKREMLPELKQALASFSLRRTKAEAELQLPPIWLTTTTVDGDTEEIRKLLREHPGMEKAVIDAVEKGGLSFLDAQHIATLRRLVGEAKAPAFLELLKEELHNGLGKVVVFGIHRRGLDHLQSGLLDGGVGVARIDGSTAERNREEAVRAFQSDPECRVFLGNIRAAGTGLTLTAASDVIMFESDWAPAANAQAIMRVHRIGQNRSVSARFITLANSIDEHVSAVVARKTAAIAQVQGSTEIA
jgi:SWI/SNF-related matrix-associated actin-dependent regulator 1 of chromatin subfamily A